MSANLSNVRHTSGFDIIKPLSITMMIIVTRPKTETTAFPLEIGQKVTVGLVRFRILPNHTLASERASRVV